MLKFNRSNSAQRNVARSLLVAAVWIFAALLSASTAFADRYVSLTGDDGGGKLGPNTCTDPTKPCKTITWAIQQAQDGDTISVAGGFYHDNHITVSKNNLTIQGTGIIVLTILSPKNTYVGGNSQDSVFYIPPSVKATFKNLVITYGKPGINNDGDLTAQDVYLILSGARGIENQGKLFLKRGYLTHQKLEGLRNSGSGSATLDRVVAAWNEDAGLRSDGGSLQVRRSVVDDNKAGVALGGGKLTMLNVTISGNLSGGLGVSGGDASLRFVTLTANGTSATALTTPGIFISAGTVKLFASIIHGNSKASGDAQCLSTPGTLILDEGYNIFHDDYNSCTGGVPPHPNVNGSIDVQDAQLVPLHWSKDVYGGVTWIHKLKSGSPAVDRVGDCTSAFANPPLPPQDQLGVARPIGPVCDSGAYEFQP